MARQLIILRHAQAENGSDDHSRGLTDKGIKASRKMGEYIKEIGLKPREIICSDALRTSQTAENICKFADIDTAINKSKKLYLATPGEILKEIANFGDEVDSLMIVGHNPGVHQLCAGLVGEGDPQLIQNLRSGFPTCAMAVLSLDVSWNNMGAACASLEDFRHC
ncbi:histidine phosphatase family protein [Rickettsiales bacterium]|nr:histidine phosphatase family protein [Rickettsiales bacterium]